MLFIGGVIGVIPFPAFEGGGKLAFYGYYWAAIYSVVVGLFVMIIEYPRGKSRKGTVGYGQVLEDVCNEIKRMCIVIMIGGRENKRITKLLWLGSA